ncbi:hypothetical protein Pfo_012730 [Paulownia fortunei]|nr:hypothetical protein Pfo_012730 [Paulownia fortunei]
MQETYDSSHFIYKLKVADGDSFFIQTPFLLLVFNKIQFVLALFQTKEKLKHSIFHGESHGSQNTSECHVLSPLCFRYLRYKHCRKAILRSNPKKQKTGLPRKPNGLFTLHGNYPERHYTRKCSYCESNNTRHNSYRKSTSPPSPPPPTTTGPTTTAPTTSGGAWCIANPTASETALQVALDYACGYGGADCSALQPNGACYDPNTVRDHASYAFNDYYQKNPIPTSCVFGGTAQLTYTDPSHGNCRYASSTSTPTTPPRTTPTIPMTPPSTPTLVTPYPPGGNGFGSEPTGYDYGSEPTGTPSSAGTISLNLLLLITMNCLILSVAGANHF